MAVNQTIQDLIKSGIFQANGNQPVLIGDTYYQPIASQIGSGMDAQQGPLENVVAYKAGDNKVGGDVKWFDPSGNYQQTTKQQEVNATKDFMDFALTAGTMFGLPTEIGKAIGLGSGAVGQAVGQGLLTTGTKLGGGENLSDALKAGLIGGSLVYGGSQLGDMISKATPIDASKMTSEQFNNALENQLVSEMKASGLSNDQISAFMDDMGIGKGVTTSTVATTPEAIDTVQATGARPTTVNVGDVYASTPTLEVSGNKDKYLDLNAVINMVNSGNLDTSNMVNNVSDTTDNSKNTGLTNSDIVKLIGAGTTLYALDQAKNGNEATTFPIVPVPEEWTSPIKTAAQNKQAVSEYPKLKPIDFGTSDLLKGTQWEKFLSPTYVQVPTQVQYSQPSNLSYNDLMGILGSKQGYPSANSLSINDIISGIQNQYGQAPTRTMG